MVCRNETLQLVILPNKCDIFCYYWQHPKSDRLSGNNNFVFRDRTMSLTTGFVRDYKCRSGAKEAWAFHLIAKRHVQTMVQNLVDNKASSGSGLFCDDNLTLT